MTCVCIHVYVYMVLNTPRVKVEHGDSTAVRYVTASVSRVVVVCSRYNAYTLSCMHKTVTAAAAAATKTNRSGGPRCAARGTG